MTSFCSTSTTAAAVLILSDSYGSKFLSQKYQHERQLSIRNIELKELFSHLGIIKKKNVNYQKLDWQSKYSTRVFNLTNNYQSLSSLSSQPIIKLNVDSVISILEIKQLKQYVKISQVSQIQSIPEEFPININDLMKKLIRLSAPLGELKVFHWYEEYQCHVGGWEKAMTAFGVDGIFLLEFYSESDF